MQTTDPNLLFHSNQQLADASNRERKALAAEAIGNPIKVTSKVLDVVVHGQEAWSAESGWQARRVDLNSGKTKMLYKGHKGPVTCVRLHWVGGPQPWLAVITSSWDKTIRVWDSQTGEVLWVLEGHSDFVKSVTVLPTMPPTLLSTSSDKSFQLWDLSPLEEKRRPQSRQVVKEHSRPVDSATFRLGDDDSLTIWTADSLGALKQWSMPQTGSGPLVFVKDLPSHETTIAGLASSEEGVWSVSMDKTARLHGPHAAILQHPSAVRSILLNPNGLPYIVTGSDDENLRVWDVAAIGDADVKPLSVVPGHCAEVLALATWVKDTGGKKQVSVVSASLDGTLRRWSIEELLNPTPLSYTPIANADSFMTEEEERELAELLSDED